MRIDLTLWWEAKELVERATGWPMDTLHVIGGVILQLVLAVPVVVTLLFQLEYLLLQALMNTLTDGSSVLNGESA